MKLLSVERSTQIVVRHPRSVAVAVPNVTCVRWSVCQDVTAWSCVPPGRRLRVRSSGDVQRRHYHIVLTVTCPLPTGWTHHSIFDGPKSPIWRNWAPTHLGPHEWCPLAPTPHRPPPWGDTGKPYDLSFQAGFCSNIPSYYIKTEPSLCSAIHTIGHHNRRKTLLFTVCENKTILFSMCSTWLNTSLWNFTKVTKIIRPV